MNYSIEIQRNNVSITEFFHYIQKRCEAKGIEVYLDRAYFENPPSAYHSSYSIVNGKKISHHSYYDTVKHFRCKMKSYTDSRGIERFYQSDEIEEYETTELKNVTHKHDDDDNASCKAETVRAFPYDQQTYILNHDGSCYNEIIEFTFDDDFRGHGYLYLMNKDAE